MAVWVVQAANVGHDGRVTRVRWQRVDAGRNDYIGDPEEVDGDEVVSAIARGDKVFALDVTPGGIALDREVRRIAYPGGPESVDPEDVRDLPRL